MQFDATLRECVDSLAGGHDVLTFIDKMKTNHALAVEYCARLLRFNTTWCGTINDPKKVIAHVRRDAVVRVPDAAVRGARAASSATLL
jgi:hypothetical protein